MIRLNSLHISRLKWHHWLLIAALILITLTRMNPYWGFFYTSHIYPLIGTVLSHISGIFPFALGDLFIALSIAWVILYPIYEIGLRKKLARRFIFLAAKSGCYPKKKAVFGRVAIYLLWIYVWFYAAWGLNYSQPNIYCRTGMKPAEVSEAKFREFAYRYADSLNYLSEERRVKSDGSEERRGKSEETAFDGQRGSQSDSIVDDKLKNRVRDAVLKGIQRNREQGRNQYSFQPASSCQDHALHSIEFDVGRNWQHGAFLLRVHPQWRHPSARLSSHLCPRICPLTRYCQ